MRFLAILAGLLAMAGSIAAILLIRSAGHIARPAAQASASSAYSTAPRVTPAPGSRVRLGVVTDNLSVFEQKTNTYPAITAKYLWWGSPFPSAEVLADHGLGVTTLIVLEPRNVSLTGIAMGQEDAYLARWAAADRSLGLPVILSFAPEANGSWYTWGARHISPDLYRQMWRHVHDVLMRDGARHITWLWQINVVWRTSEPLSMLWPGRAYVDTVGIDGQMKRGKTFTSAFGPTLAQIRAVTSAPVMLSEVAVRKGSSRPAQIAQLFSGASSRRLTAVILFDVHAHWSFDNDPATLAALRTAAAEYK